MPSSLDYSSWLFQVIAVLAILYLVVGLAKPSLVHARSRASVAVASAVALLIAATAFYLAVRKLPGGDDTASEIHVAPPEVQPSKQ